MVLPGRKGIGVACCRRGISPSLKGPPTSATVPPVHACPELSSSRRGSHSAPPISPFQDHTPKNLPNSHINSNTSINVSTIIDQLSIRSDRQNQLSAGFSFTFLQPLGKKVSLHLLHMRLRDRNDKVVLFCLIENWSSVAVVLDSRFFVFSLHFFIRSKATIFDNIIRSCDLKITSFRYYQETCTNERSIIF